MEPTLIVGGESFNRHGPIPHSQAVLISLEEQGAKLMRRLAARRVWYDCGEKALTRCGQIFELIVRQWLVEEGFGLDPRRTIYYHAADESGAMKPFSRETDGICVNTLGEPQLVVEVRLSVQGMRAYRQKRSQLAETLRLLRQSWPRVRGFMVFVSVGPEPIETNPQKLLSGIHLDPKALELAYGPESGILEPDFPVAVLPLPKLVAWARRRRWWFHPSLLLEAQRFAEARWRRRHDHLH